MDNERMRLEISDEIGRVTFCRPEAANAIDLAFAREFERTAFECLENQVRVVLMSADGSQFCAGGDVKSFNAQPDIPNHIAEVTTHLHSGITTFVQMDAPVIASVQGSAAGAGLGLVCAADLAIASDSAKFLMAYTALGLSPDGSSSWFLPRHVGLRRAIELTLTNRVLTADEALSWGIVSRVVADNELSRVSEDLASSISAGPTAAYGASTRLLRAATNDSLIDHLAEESRSIASLSGTVDGVEGIRAFAERRRATFVGTEQSPMANRDPQ